MTSNNLAEVFDPDGESEETIQEAIDSCQVNWEE